MMAFDKVNHSSLAQCHDGDGSARQFRVDARQNKQQNNYRDDAMCYDSGERVDEYGAGMRSVEHNQIAHLERLGASGTVQSHLIALRT
jgi:hypothetical protein